MKKQIAGFLAATMITAMIPTVALASNFEDMPTDWSTAALEAAVSNGLLKGDNGKIMPKALLTRAQMAAIISRAFGTTEKASLSSFNDVPASAWYYNDMAKAVQMQAFKGSGNQLNPNNYITREEAFVVLARAFKLSEPDTKVLNQFSDKSSISSWAEGGIAGLVAKGYVAGAEGKLNPKQNITRAEFAKIMDNLVKTYIQKEGTYSKDTKGNVMVNVPGAVLKNMTITGDLIVGDGVGNGEVTLENVVVTGTAIVRGGGVNSIRIIGNSNIKNIVIARVNGEVRVFADDGTEVGTVVVDGDDNVIIEGNIGEIRVETSNITVTAKNATIDSIVMNGTQSKIVANANATVKNVTVNAKDAEIVAEKGSTIKKVEANQEGIRISGAGTVVAVKANANNIVVKTNGTSVTAATGTTGVVAGSTNVSGGSTTTVSDSTTNTGGGGGGGGGGSSSIAVSAISITGTTTVGQTLTANTTPINATVSYQWMRSDTVNGTYANIAGATSSTYVLTSNDSGKYIKVVVIGTGSYTGTQTSAATAAVAANSSTAEIFYEAMLGLPTSEVTVKLDGNDVLEFDLYFDGECLASTTNGKIVVASAVLIDLSRVEVKIGDLYYSDWVN